MFKKLRNKFLLLNMTMISVLLIAAFVLVFTMVYRNTKEDIETRLDMGLSSVMPGGMRENEKRDMHRVERSLDPVSGEPMPPGGDNPAENSNGENSGDSPSGENPAERPDGNFDENLGGENPAGAPHDLGSENGEPIPPDESLETESTDDETTEKEQPEITEVSAIKLDADGNVLQVNSPYYYGDDFYEIIAQEAVQKCVNLDERVSDVIKIEDSYFEYLAMYHKHSLEEDGDLVYYVSFTNIDSRLGVLRSLILTLFFVLIVALALLFLLCMYFANKSIKPIEDAWEKQNQFIADASHELKTPLTTINTNVDVLLAHGDGTIEEESKWLYYIKDEAARMAKLTNDLLYLAKVDHSAENHDIKTVFSFSSAAENVILTMEAVIFENNLMFTDDIDDDIYVKGNAEQIKQLVMILLDNAVKYTKPGGDISVTLKKVDNKARLSVKNASNGIPPEDAERIFDRFYRSDKSRARNSGGYGLGLAIAKMIVTNHKGTIRQKSMAGVSTEFIAEIPTVSKPANK